MQLIKDRLREINHFFGYNTHPTEQNDTAFVTYNYDSPQDKRALEMFRGYQAFNKQQMEAMRLRATDRANGKVVEQIPNFVHHPTLMGPLNMTLFNLNSRLIVPHLLTYDN